MPHRCRRRRGMTLIEVLTSAGLMVMVVLGASTLLISGLWQWSRDSSSVIAQDDASLGLQRVVRAVSNGKSAQVTNDILYVTFPGVDGNGEYDRFRDDGVTHAFEVRSGVLLRTDENGAVETLARNVDTAQFAVVGTTVRVALRTERQTGRHPMGVTLTMAAPLRNAVID